MSSFPLQIVIIRHIFTYYYYLNSKDDSSIVKHALNISCTKIAKKSQIRTLTTLITFLNFATTDFPVSLMTSQTVLSVKQLHDYRTNILNTGKVKFVLHLDYNSFLK